MDTERGRYTYLGTPKTTFLMHSLRTNTRVIITATLASTLLLSALLYASDVPSAALQFVAPSYYSSLPRARGRHNVLPTSSQTGPGSSRRLNLYTPTPEVARDPLAPLGFAGCASGRERTWHLGMSEDGTPDHNHNDLWEYVVRGASYDWVPRSQSCRIYNEKVEAEDFATMLIERGGWFFVGDSVTEQHFFSMSCMLYPHVRATPDYAPTGGSGPRDWPQHLYLNPSSPLLTQLSSRMGSTLTVHRSIRIIQPLAQNLPRPIHAAAPEGNYKTLIVSTAGHWTTGSLPGARDPEDVQAGATNPGVYKTFVEAVRVWTDQVSRALSADTRAREVLVRAYLPGHEYDCHKESGPLTQVREFSQEWYNWSWIGRMNEAFKAAIAQKGDSQIKFLGLDKMALLRPDAHSLSDCLHIQIGAGIFEGWSRYIWHLGDDMTKLGRTRLGQVRL
ncbi:hypothetical protein RhiXN_10709 [Rhizoctonia solani]|uniref:Trichome birefringence-like C-terminal domain-containing protein n=1 Tax=Rhizoctonia solani TaxID=456999 RepID=A0A8H8T2J2_9AGAM|nr:uncharacterized protein RhiXN_10709 [Rhizoctonia solani]QRW25633.1 hypothetical protein RhiXN_10709 [Rhizoctonia solani]